MVKPDEAVCKVWNISFSDVNEAAAGSRDAGIEFVRVIATARVVVTYIEVSEFYGVQP